MKKIFTLVLLGLVIFTGVNAALGPGVIKGAEGIYYCSDPMKEYSAGTCDCKFPYVLQSDGSCGAAKTSNPLSESTEANNAAEYSRTKCEGTGGSWNGSSCSCPHECNLSGGYCVGPGAECAGEDDVKKWSGGSSGGESNFSGGGGGGGSGSSSSSGGFSRPTSVTVSGPTTASTGSITNPIGSGTFAELIDMIVKWILDIAMVLAPLVIVYGGITYITAAGDPSKMKTAKQIIIYACLGFLLALLASSLINILKGLAGGGN